MEYLRISLAAVFPIFAMLLVGYVIRQTNMCDDKSLKQMNAVCFKVFMSAMMFSNVYNMNISRDLDVGLLLFVLVSVLVMIAVTAVLVIHFEPDNRKRGVVIQAIYRSNFVVLGIPLVTSVYGEEAAGVPTLLVSLVVPLYNVFAVIVLEYFGGGSEKRSPWDIVKSVITNPYIVAALIAGFLLVMPFKVPALLTDTVTTMGHVASPLAVVLLGASLTFDNMKKYSGYLSMCCLLRLVVVPFVFLGLAILLGYRDVKLMALVAVFATPTAVSSYAMAQQLGGDDVLAGAEVVVSSVVSVVTLFLWIFGLQVFGVL